MSKFDMYAEVTSRIIKALESGVIPWEKPWVGKRGAWSRNDGKNYCLINQLLLPAGEYATLKTINEDGGKVKKGAKAKQVWQFYYKLVEETDEETGEVTRKFLPRQRYENVFNVAEDTDLEIKWHKDEFDAGGIEPNVELELIKDDYIARSHVTMVNIAGDEACYYPALDTVKVPEQMQFSNVAEYYSTVFHELAHSTGHPTRLNRFESGDMKFGSDDYSREELVAELTSCAILANRGVETSSSFRNNAAYIGAWVKALKDDSKMIIRAAAKAERAYNLIMGVVDDNAEDDSADK